MRRKPRLAAFAQRNISRARAGWLRLRKKLVNISVFIAASIVALLVCEAVFRYIVPPPNKVRKIEFYNRMYQPDELLGHTLRPNIRDERLTTNSLGFRGGELKPGKINVICIGDSHTFGWAVDDEFTYPQQLQYMLGEDVNVLNMGVGGYNIARETALLERYIERLKPKLLIFEVTVDDILKEDLPFGPIALNEQGHVYEPEKKMRIRSALLTYIKDRLPGMQVKLGLRKPAHEEYLRFWEDKQRFEAYEREIRRTVEKLKGQSSKIIFVTFPFPSQVYLKGEGDWPSVRFFRSLEDADIKYIDLLPVFQANYRKFSTLYLEDGHPNEYAYKLVAQEVFKVIKREDYLTGRGVSQPVILKPEGLKDLVTRKNSPRGHLDAEGN